MFYNVNGGRLAFFKKFNYAKTLQFSVHSQFQTCQVLFSGVSGTKLGLIRPKTCLLQPVALAPPMPYLYMISRGKQLLGRSFWNPDCSCTSEYSLLKEECSQSKGSKASQWSFKKLSSEAYPDELSSDSTSIIFGQTEVRLFEATVRESKCCEFLSFLDAVVTEVWLCCLARGLLPRLCRRERVESLPRLLLLRLLLVLVATLPWVLLEISSGCRDSSHSGQNHSPGGTSSSGGLRQYVCIPTLQPSQRSKTCSLVSVPHMAQ